MNNVKIIRNFKRTKAAVDDARVFLKFEIKVCQFF